MEARWMLAVFLCLALHPYVYGIDDLNVCQGDHCHQLPSGKIIDLNLLDDYCKKICYGDLKHLYENVCDCENVVTEPPGVCRTSYLEDATCNWSLENCNGTEYCEWRKNMSVTIMENQNITAKCDCPLKMKNDTDPCQWPSEETALCSILKVSQILPTDFKCMCHEEPPTPKPGDSKICEYSKYRKAQLVPNRSKRLFRGAESFACNYPGVVGLFVNLGADKKSICTATLLGKQTILFDHQCKTAMGETVYALVDSYDIKVVNELSPVVNMETIVSVDPNSADNVLFTANLSRPVTFNDRCATPACIPCVRIPAHHIDISDCRVLGYGDKSDTYITGPQAKKLEEIHVSVDPTSVTGDILKVRRKDGVPNTACVNDYSAPLVCAHKYTKEWITIGIHTMAGPVCSGHTLPITYQVTSLLSEAMGNRYYWRLKAFHPQHSQTLPH